VGRGVTQKKILTKLQKTHYILNKNVSYYYCCYCGLLFSQGHPAAEPRNMVGDIDSLYLPTRAVKKWV